MIPIGPLQLPDRLLALAPMEDVSDIPFRLVCRRLGADIVYTEFTSSEALIRDAKKALRKIMLSDEERPVGIQIYGGVETSMEGAARVADSFGPDLIDINCGCWVKNHALRGEGAGLLRDLGQFERIVRATIKGTTRPVTVKTRLGWDHENIVILDVARMVEQAGAKALTVHCRTRTQGYKGAADWQWLEKIKKVISIPLIGNGDVTAPEDARRMFETGCDGVMIGRGAIMNPWIFREIKHYLRTGEVRPTANLEERIVVCLQHLKMTIDRRGERLGVQTFRKYLTGYLRDQPHAAKLRSELMTLNDYTAVERRLHRYRDEMSGLSPA